MRAVGFRRYGPPEALETLEVAKPEPGPGEVLIRVAAAGVNPADTYLRAGRLRLFARLKLPAVPGADVAGVVEAVGANVTRLRPGDAVYAMLPPPFVGGYAEYASVPEANVAPAPQGVSLADAAGVPLAALTALQALRDKAGLKAGDRLLVNGASGGVGTFAVQIAKAMGASVTGICSGRNAGLVRDLGADEVLDYARQEIAAGGPRYDAVFDAANALPFRRARRALRPGGVFVTVNPALGNPVSRLLARVTGGGRRLESVFVRPSGADLEVIRAWISAGKVRSVIDRTYPLSEAADAHRHSETRRARGKIVLVVDAGLAATTAKPAPR
jgi:NADPH:quinone reductase-like Zn-dependent oxidoreductase